MAGSQAGFVSVPVIPVFSGMSKEFANKLEAPAKKAGERAGKSMSAPLDGAVANLEKQVKASSKTLDKLDTEYEKKRRKQSLREEQEKEAKELLRRAEERYNKAVEEGSKTVDSAYKQVSAAKIKATKASNDLADAQADTNAAEKKHKDQLDDLNETSAKLSDAQVELAESTDASGQSFAEASEESERFGKAMDGVALGIMGMATGAVAGLASIGADFQEMSRTVAVGTGATGDALRDLEESAMDVATNVPVSFDEAANAIAGLNTMTGESGPALERLSEQVLNASNLLGEDGVSNANDFGNALSQWEIDADDGASALDGLFAVTQNYGIGLGEVTGHLNTFGSVLNNAGFSMEESAVLFGSLEKSGLSVSRIMPGLNSAFRGWAEEGLNVQETLADTVGQIESAETAQEALALATEEFGAEGAQRLTTAIRNGSFALEDFDTALGDTSGLIDQTAEDNRTLGESFEMFKNEALVAIEPIATELIDWLIPAMESMVEKLEDALDWISENEQLIKGLAVGAGVAAAAFVTWRGSVLAINGAMKIFQLATTLSTTGVRGLNTAMKANIFGLIATAIAGLVAGLVYFFTQTETGQKMWEKFTTALADGWDWVVEKLSAGWDWMRDNVFTPLAAFVTETLWPALESVFTWIGEKWQWLSDTLGTVWGWIRENVIDRMILGFQNIWDKVVEVADWVADKWSWLKDMLIAGWNLIYEWVISPYVRAFEWLWEKALQVVDWIVGKWNWMRDKLGEAWQWIDENVFAKIGSGLDTVKGWFQTGVDAIKEIWDGIKEAAAAPVRFMVETVWNKGIIRAIDAVAGVVGMDGPDEIQLGFARGGILPGWSRMSDGDNRLVPMRDGEGVLVSEGLQDQRSRDLFMSANEQAKRGTSFGEFMTDYVAGYANGGIVGSLNSIMREFYPELQMTSGLRPGDSGYHGKNMAADFSNTGSGMPSTPAMQSAAKFMFGNYGDQLEQLIHHPARNIGSGRDVGDGFGYYGAGTLNEHTDHIHLAAMNPLVDPSGVVQMMPYDGESGGDWWNPLTWAKKAWDEVVNAIAPYPDEGEGFFSQIPGNFLSSAAGKVWDWAKSKIGAGSFDGDGGTSGSAESWRDMAISAMRRNGFNADDPAQVNAMIAQIQSESSGNPSAIQGIVDVNSGGNEAAGLLQVIPGTFAAHRDPSLPDDRMDAWSNMNAALRYYKSKYGTDLTTMWGQGHGYSEGGIVDLLTRDLGGWVPDGALVRNTSGRDEMMLPPELSKAMSGFFADYPEAAKVLLDAAEHIESASEFLNKAAVYQSEEGVTARQTVRGVLDLGLDLPGSDVVLAVLDGEEQIWAARERQLGHLDTLVEKEKAIKDARKALADLEDSEDGLSTQDQRKLDDAKKAVEESKADAAKSESDEKRAAAADKVTDAEEKLKRVREDLDANAEENAKKHAEEITSANEAVMKAEEEYSAARQQQVKDLDHITVISQSNFADMASQATSIAGQLVSMGAPAGAVASGLSAVTGALGQASAMAGPAGVSLGMALQAISVGIQLVEMVVTKIKELIDFINRVRLEALQATADGLQVIADYASLVTDMQRNIGSLQQEIVRGMNEQRTAELNLRIAQQDRLVAEAEGTLAVHEARLALDEEIRKGQVAAQIRMMGLYEDWDSYLSFQALVGQGVLEQWSDAAISALFTYEQARAKALHGELQARVEQINAEAALAEATRANVRNQQDLLTAQERLIRMSAQVAGIDLVDATSTSQVANLVVQMAELQQKMDSNWAGKAGAFLGTSGPWSNEYRGQKSAMDGMRAALDAVLAETGVSLSNSQIDKAIEQMKWVSATEGDPLAVLRQFMPELVQAETALKIDEVMKPIDDARDAQRETEREAEDFRSEIDLYEKLAPLEELIKGLDYTIEGLGKASDAWDDGNEDLRAEYLAAAQANRDAARELGVSWGLDDRYATGAVREQITKEVTIHLDGREVYSADQVDELLADVTSGSNVRVNVDKSAKSVAASRRGGMA